MIRRLSTTLTRLRQALRGRPGWRYFAWPLAGLAIGAVVVLAGILGVLVIAFSFEWLTATASQVKASEVARNYGLMLAGVVGFGLGFWRVIVADRQRRIAAREAELSEQRGITETYARAVDLLASNSTFARVGAIYALERIAKDSERDHWPIMEILSAFIRNTASSDDKDVAQLDKPYPEVQAALTVLGRRDVSREGDQERLDLSDTILRRASLQGAQLPNTLLYHVDLREATFRNANLSGSTLLGGNFRGSIWVDADLTGATLWSADLRGDLGLTCEQLTKAKDWERAYRSPELACGADIPEPPEDPDDA